jgi:CBS domain-containing protein
VHHLPVTDDGAIVGVITSTDLLRCTAQGPIAVLRGIERLASRKDLAGYARRVAEMTAALLAGRLDATVIAAFVAQLNDTLLRRILRWAEAELGQPPAPYAWIVFGSEGRAEQTLLTDQDNALVYADEGGGHRAWFQSLADRVNEDLVAAGFPRCPGGYMASSWHGTTSEWKQRFRGWIEVPTPQAILVAAIFFDFRRVGGDLDLAPLEAAREEAGRRPAFLRAMARAALEFRTPGVTLRLKGGAASVDLKAHGISPVVYLARCYGLEAGARSPNTVQRLEAARRAGLLQEGEVAAIVEAYRFLLGVRLRFQLGAGPGSAVPSTIPLSALRAVERSRLKDTFHAIRTWQERSAFKYQVDT